MPTSRMRLARVGKIPTTAVRRDLLVQPLQRVRAPDPRPMGLREDEVDEQVGLGLDEQVGDCREASGQAVGHPPELLRCGVLVGLLEDRADDRRDHAPGGAWHEVLGIPGEVDPTTLPRRSQELLADGLDETPVVVADDEPDPAEAALHEGPDEGRPGAALIVAGAPARAPGSGARRWPRRRHATSRNA